MHVHTVPLRSTAFLLVATSAWGGMFSVAKDAIQWLDPVFVTLVRYSAVSVVLTMLLVLSEGTSSLGLDGRGLKLAVFGVSGMAGFNILALYGLKTASPVVAAMIMVTLPFLSSLIKWMLDGIPVQAHLMWCILLAMGGVLLVVTHGDVGMLFSGRVGRGEALVFAGAIFWAVYTVGRERFPAWSALRYGALSTGMGSAGLLAIWEISISIGALEVPSVDDIKAVACQLGYLVTIAGILAITAWAEGIKRTGAVTASLFMCFVPITAFIVDVVAGYRPGSPELVGGVMAIGALFVDHHFSRRA